MTTLCNAYASEATARKGVGALRAAGVPAHDIQLLTGSRRRDVRRELVGGFAGPVDPAALVGTFGNARRLRRQGTGTFFGDGDRQRQGTFADSDRDLIISQGQMRVAGEVRLRRLLRQAEVDRAVADRVVDELHAGQAVVVAEVAEITPSDAHTRLEHAADAA
jgi:hypothetical protein